MFNRILNTPLITVHKLLHLKKETIFLANVMYV